MLKHLTIEIDNFRKFSEEIEFKIAPITLLIGPNSSGKSSLLKAIQLINENINSENFPVMYELDRKKGGTFIDVKTIGLKDIILENESKVNTYNPLPLNLQSNVHKLYNNKSVLNDISKPFKVVFSNLESNIPLKYAFEFSAGNQFSLIANFAVQVLDMKDNVIIEYGSNSVYFDPFVYENYYNELLQCNPNIAYEYLDYEGKQRNAIDLSIFDDLPKNFSKKVEKRIEVGLKTWFLETFSINDFTKDSQFRYLSNFIEQTLGIDTKMWMNDKNTAKNANNLFQIFVPSFNIFKNVEYFASNRTSQKFTYSQEGNTESDNIFKKAYEIIIENEIDINQIGNLFGVNGFKIEYDEEQRTYIPNINKRALADYGYGYAQLFTQVSKIIGSLIFENDKDSSRIFREIHQLFLIEEPESNLHPNLQSKLADFYCNMIYLTGKHFIDSKNHGYPIINEYELAPKGNTFVIETHSEYMVRKFQYLVAKGKLKKEDIVIYYFHDENKQPTKIDILEDGRLSQPFGVGFYDETARIMSALLTGENLN